MTLKNDLIKLANDNPNGIRKHILPLLKTSSKTLNLDNNFVPVTEITKGMEKLFKCKLKDNYFSQDRLIIKQTRNEISISTILRSKNEKTDDDISCKLTTYVYMNNVVKTDIKLEKI